MGISHTIKHILHHANHSGPFSFDLGCEILQQFKALFAFLEAHGGILEHSGDDRIIYLLDVSNDGDIRNFILFAGKKSNCV